MKTLALLSSALLVSSIAFAEGESAGFDAMQSDPGVQEQMVQEAPAQLVEEPSAQMVEEAAPAMEATSDDANQITSPEIIAEQPAAGDQQAQAGASAEKKWWQFWNK